MKIFEVTSNQIDFDIVDDLTFFMEDDDVCYKTHLMPLELKIEAAFKRGKSVSADIFAGAVTSAYKMYKEKFDLKNLPATLDKETVKDCCIKLQDIYHAALSNKKEEI